MSCIVCNSKTIFFISKDSYQYQKCPSCGLIFVNPQPTEEHLAHEVYSKQAGYQKHKKSDLSVIRENSHIKKILDFLEGTHYPAHTFIPKFSRTLELVFHTKRVGDLTHTSVNKRLLDVGCSSGEFLYAATKRGFETYGVELNELTARIAITNGLNVKIGTLESAQYQNNFFDAIFLGDIIEHVKNPRELLVECRRILKSKGVLIVSTPNLDSFWAKTTFKLYKWFNIPWSALTPPHHLFQFSEDNLKQFLTQNGFIPLTVWFRRPPTLLYELGSLHLWGKFKRQKTLKNFFFMFFAFAVYTKLYVLDILVTSFKKKDFGMIIVSIKQKD